MKYVVFDVMSLFQLSSALSVVLDKGRVGDEADIYVMRNLKSIYCSEELCFDIDGIRVNVKHQEGNLIKNNKFLLKIIFFIFGRFLFFRSRKFSVIHHTYFKPTSLCYFDLKDVFGLNIYSFEEGVGTYGGFFHHKKTAFTERKKWAGCKYLLRVLLSGFVHEKFSVLCFFKEKNKFLFSRSVKLLSRLNGADDSSITRLGYDRSKDNFLFVSSPMLRRNQDEIVRYRNLLDKIKKTYSDYNIFVKLHPLESNDAFFDEYGFFILDGNLSGEYVVDFLKPKILVGPHSGLLLSAMNVYGSRCFVIDLGLDIDSSIKKIYKDIPEFNYD